MHDGVDINLVALQSIVARFSLVHDVNAIGHLFYLLQIRRDEQHRDVLGGNTAEQLIDVITRRDVHTARRLIHDQHLRRGFKAFGDQDFLLITARERAGRLFRIVELDIKRAAIAFERGAVFGRISPETAVVVG